MSCLGKVCTVQHRNPYCGGGRNTPVGLASKFSDAKANVETSRIMRAALLLWSQDPHEFSRRPCSTCDVLSELIGEPYGCIELRLGAK